MESLFTLGVVLGISYGLTGVAMAFYFCANVVRDPQAPLIEDILMFVVVLLFWPVFAYMATEGKL